MEKECSIQEAGICSKEGNNVGSISAVFSSPVFDPPEKGARAHFPNSGWLSSLATTSLKNDCRGGECFF